VFLNETAKKQYPHEVKVTSITWLWCPTSFKNCNCNQALCIYIFH